MGFGRVKIVACIVRSPQMWSLCCGIQKKLLRVEEIIEDHGGQATRKLPFSYFDQSFLYSFTPPRKQKKSFRLTKFGRWWVIQMDPFKNKEISKRLEIVRPPPG